MDLGMNTEEFLKLYQFNMTTVAFSTATYCPLNSVRYEHVHKTTFSDFAKQHKNQLKETCIELQHTRHSMASQVYIMFQQFQPFNFPS